MTRREIPLILNHPFGDIELGHWLNLFDSPACKVTRKEDGGYYLTACRLEKPAEAYEVRESAEKLIIMMTAFAKIELDTDFQSIQRDDKHFISGFREYRDDKTVNYVFLVGSSSDSVGKAIVTSELPDKDSNVVRQERWYDYYLDQCDDWIDNTVVFKALDYFAVKTTPLTLRSTYYTILYNEGGKDRLLKNDWGVTGDEISDFTHSINHPDMEGQTLHVKNPTSKNNYTPMNLEQARTVLTRILKPWLIKTQEKYKLAEGYSQAKHLADILGTVRNR
jgi:hypothetical protein